MVGAVLLVAIVAGGAYLVFADGSESGDAAGSTAREANISDWPDVEQSETEEIFFKAVEQAVSYPAGEEVPGYFEVNSGDLAFQGEFYSTVGEEEYGRLRGEMEINSTMDGVPMSMKVEMIVVEEEDRSETYGLFKSVTSPEPGFKNMVEDTFAPGIGIWTKMDIGEDDTEEEASSFREDGSMAAMDLADVLMPIAALNESDRETFLRVGIDHGVYEVNDGIEAAQFQGREARKISVAIDKNALIESDEELAQALSDESGHDPISLELIEQAFGDSDTLTADIFLDPDKDALLGAHLRLKLDPPIREREFDTKLGNIEVKSWFLKERNLVSRPRNRTSQRTSSTS